MYNPDIQNDTLRISDCTPEQGKMTRTGVQNEALVSNKITKNRKKLNKREENGSERKRQIGDLTTEEAQRIIASLKKGEKYVDLTRKYGLEHGAITKNFEKEWKRKKTEALCNTEQELMKEQRKKETKINYSQIERRRDDSPNERIIDIEEIITNAEWDCEESIPNSQDGSTLLACLQKLIDEKGSE